MEERSSLGDALLERRLADYIERHSRLVDLQIDGLEAARRASEQPPKPKSFVERLKDAAALLTSMGVLITTIAVLVMSWNAAHDHGLVVEAYSVPADMTARGLTGQVMARKVLDRLADLEARSASIRAASSYGNDWGADLKIELPQTGVSISELSRELRGWLGHETHIAGDVYRSDAALTVTTRIGQSPVVETTGVEAHLDKMLQEAAEAIYGRTQPYRYAIYLQYYGRYLEANQVLNQLASNPDRMERAWAHKGLAVFAVNQAHDPIAWARESRASLAEVGAFAPGLENLEYAESALGHDHAARLAAIAYLKASGSLRRQIAPDQQKRLTLDVMLRKEQLEGDYEGAVAAARDLEHIPVSGAQADARVALPLLLALDHDIPDARAAAAEPRAVAADGPTVAGLAALENGDPQATALLARAWDLEKAGQTGPVGATAAIAPWLTIALARAGETAHAQALIQTTPLDCYLCLRARGAVAADRREAEHWFAEAIAKAPDLPQAFVDRGAARLGWGDIIGARSDVHSAIKAGPHDPDAWKLSGDISAKQGRWREARASYETALGLAPAWDNLRRTLALAKARPD